MKQFDITTFDIQRMMISVIVGKTDNHRTIPIEWFDLALGRLTELNNMCRKSNDYTLTITVKQKEN